MRTTKRGGVTNGRFSTTRSQTKKNVATLLGLKTLNGAVTRKKKGAKTTTTNGYRKLGVLGKLLVAFSGAENREKKKW